MACDDRGGTKNWCWRGTFDLTITMSAVHKAFSLSLFACNGEAGELKATSELCVMYACFASREP